MDFFEDLFSKVGVAGLDNIINRRQHWTRHQRVFYWAMFVFLVCSSVAFVTSSYLSYMEKATAFSVDRRRDMKCIVEAYTVCTFPTYRSHKVDAYIRRAYGNLSTKRRQYYQTFIRGLANFSIFGLDKFDEHWFDPTLPGGQYDELTEMFQYKESKINAISNSCMGRGGDAGQCAALRTKHKEAGLCFCYGCQYENNSKPGIRTRVDTDGAKVYEPCMDGSIHQFQINSPRESRVYIHSPFDIPNYEEPNIITQIHKKGLIYDFQPQILDSTAEKRMLSLNVHQRKCQFPFEATLTVAPFYTQTMCAMQCRMNMAAKECGCIPHIYPLRGQKPCDAKGLSCLSSLSDRYLNTFTKPEDCQCEPTCGFVTIKKDPHVTPVAVNSRMNNVIFIRFYQTFLEDTIQVQDLIYSTVDLLASWGGAVSFFLDMSILTLLELLYLTARSPVLNLRLPRWRWLKIAKDFTFLITRSILKHFQFMKWPVTYFTLHCKSAVAVLHAVVATAKEWLSATTLHGVKHIGNSGNRAMERILWGLVFVLFIVISYWVSVMLMDGLTVVMYEYETRQTLIPFHLPSFSVCRRDTPFSGVHYAITNFIMFPTHLIITTIKQGHKNPEGFPTEESWSNLYKDTRNCKGKLIKCALNEEEFNCCEEFRYLATEIGPCFTFNSLQTFNALQTREETRKLIGRKLNATQHTKLTLRLTLSPSRLLNITMLYFHSWADVPSMQDLFRKVAHGVQPTLQGTVKLHEILVDKDVINLSPSDRRCRMHWETLPGSFYPSYSYSSCLAECRAQKIMEICGCIHPMTPDSRNLPVCSPKNISCFMDNYDEITMPLEWSTSNCSCLRVCNDVHFSYAGAKSLTVDYKRQEHAYEHTIVASHHRLRLRLMTSSVDKFVLVGGVFSLFLGASVMNVMEIFFFCTFRLVWHIKQQFHLM